MKLVLQIAFGVFLGTLASQFTMEGWHHYQENRAERMAEKRLAEEASARRVQGERIRALLLQGRGGGSGNGGKPPAGFVPDDVQGP